MTKNPLLPVALCLLLVALPITFASCCGCIGACTSSCEESFSTSIRRPEPPSVQRMTSDGSETEHTHPPRIPEIPPNPDAEDVGDAFGMMCGSCFGSLFKCLCCYGGSFRNDPEVFSYMNSHEVDPTFIEDDIEPDYKPLSDRIRTLSKSTLERPKSPSQKSKSRSFMILREDCTTTHQSP